MEPAQLKAARKELGLKQTEMAIQLRSSRSGYVKWKRGERRISPRVERAVELLLKFDREFMQRVRAGVKA